MKGRTTCIHSPWLSSQDSIKVILNVSLKRQYNMLNAHCTTSVLRVILGERVVVPKIVLDEYRVNTSYKKNLPVWGQTFSLDVLLAD